MEARAFFHIGTHLRRQGIPVPEIFEFDPDSGLLIVEDLGGLHLYDFAIDALKRRDHEGLARQYRAVLDLLIDMQILGAEGFDTGWCWQGPSYDVPLCIEKEAGYFIDALVKTCLGLRPDEALESVFMEEARVVCSQVASEQYAIYFLHRDFQSRNLMLRGNEGGRASICVIDFQAGRLGPPLYDLASLLHDPYVELPWSLREELLDYYLIQVYKHLPGQRSCPEGHGRATGGEKGPGGRAFHRDLFWMLSLMRLLQAAGAYGYLSAVMGRQFFRPFIAPALRGLKRVLGQPRLAGLQAISEIVEMAEEAVTAIEGISARGPSL